MGDDDAPKKALSSFMLYSVDARERVKKEDPDIKQTDILKKIGAEWKSLSEGEKKKWEDKAKAEKVRYEKEMAAYKPEGAAGTKRPAPRVAPPALRKQERKPNQKKMRKKREAMRRKTPRSELAKHFQRAQHSEPAFPHGIQFFAVSRAKLI